ncbi:MAG: PilW family protein [Geothrix sp.]
MTLRSFQRFRPLQRGFSLIEMLVAMLFIGVLTAGMLRVYSTNLAGVQRVNDMIGSQRRGHWALGSMQDDLASIGYFANVGFNNPAAGNYSVTNGTQEPFMILPDPLVVTVTGPNPASPGALVTGPLVPPGQVPHLDEIQYVSDRSLPIQATLSAITTAGLSLNLISGSTADLQAGDIVAVQDGNFEQFIISVVSGNSVGVDLAATVIAQAVGGVYQVTTPGTKAHLAGVPLSFYRPNIVTRYSVQALAWDPSNSAITVPCLVRQQTAYPVGGTAITWAGVPVEIIAENIDGLRIDLSVDGGTNWLRQDAANWAEIAGRITTALVPMGATGTPLRDASNPLWFRIYPCLIRVDVSSRSATPRAGSSNVAGQADYARRTQTLMVTPRNFGFHL